MAQAAVHKNWPPMKDTLINKAEYVDRILLLATRLEACVRLCLQIFDAVLVKIPAGNTIYNQHNQLDKYKFQSAPCSWIQVAWVGGFTRDMAMKPYLRT